MSTAITSNQPSSPAATLEGALLDIDEIARIYRTKPASIRTSLWKHRCKGRPLRFPLPIPGVGRLWWRREDVVRHLDSLNPASGSVMPATVVESGNDSSGPDRRSAEQDEDAPMPS